MKKSFFFLQRLENIIIIVTFSVMVIASFSQVVNRNIFKLGIGWFEELVVYCMIWMTLLGAEMGLRDGTQVSITAVRDSLPERGKSFMHIVVTLIVVLFSAAITRNAIDMVLRQIKTGQTSAGLNVPMAVPYSALVLGFGIMTLVQSFSLILMIVRLFKAPSNKEREI
ncbi:MAG: TRAP transporter small permease [Spirochaetaceae bacterium]|jgi:C4-dicarboxylate transporter DctM subunit|nr:TRAP transporter small permease [Spirochaetaceae bacterium]